jgi:radical SAM protein with 4Fe4S-binding SPASM domain
MTIRTYAVPPEHHVFERDSKYLLLDPANFIWFVTDEKGKAVFDGLCRTHTHEGAVAALAGVIGCNPDHAEIHSYVEKYIEYLLKIGFLHEGEYRQAELPSGMAESPLVLYIHLTSKCNLKCPYCYNQEHRTELIQIGKVSDSSQLTTEGRTSDFLKIVDEAAELGFVEVKLTGGEATLNKDFLVIAARAKSRGLRVNLLTNGSFITPSLARQIAECVDSVSISIDSDKPEEHDAVRGAGTHAKAVNAFKLLREAGVKGLHTNAVITSINVESVGNFLDYAVNTLKADKVTTAGSGMKVEDPRNRWGAEDYRLTKDQQYRIYEQSRDFFDNHDQQHRRPIHRTELFRRQCGVGNGIVSIDANGDLYPCQTLHRKEFQCGNAFKSGLRAVLEQSEVIKNTKKAAVDILPECRTCPVRYICAGGCRSEAYTVEGDFLARNRTMCPTYFAGAVDQLWNSASVPVQDSDTVFQPGVKPQYCVD